MVKGDKNNMYSQRKNICMHVCNKVAYVRSLTKGFDVPMDVETSQLKKTSTRACLTIIEKNKGRSNTQERVRPLWLGFKAMNALNQVKGYEEVKHKSVSELMRMGMTENESSEC